MREKHVFGPVHVDVPPDLSRADLELYGIDHFRPSYTARVFFNDPDVDVDDSSEDRASFAGDFAVFGHQRCVGDDGHCHVHEHLRRFDDRPSHPLTRAFKRVIVTEALRRVQGDELTVTLIVTSGEEAESPQLPLLSFEAMQIATFSEPAS